VCRASSLCVRLTGWARCSGRLLVTKHRARRCRERTAVAIPTPGATSTRPLLKRPAHSSAASACTRARSDYGQKGEACRRMGREQAPAMRPPLKGLTASSSPSKPAKPPRLRCVIRHEEQAPQTPEKNTKQQAKQGHEILRVGVGDSRKGSLSAQQKRARRRRVLRRPPCVVSPLDGSAPPRHQALGGNGPKGELQEGVCHGQP
jgi:hypothetical protein